jgi:hypothetical protein
MLEPAKVRTEMKALQKHFKEKRDYVVGRLREMGFHIKTVPDSTFYLWLDLEGLPEASTTSVSHFLSPYPYLFIFFSSLTYLVKLEDCRPFFLLGNIADLRSYSFRRTEFLPSLPRRARHCCTWYLLRFEPEQEERFV